MASDDAEGTPAFRVGDCVVALYDIGLFRPRVRRGTQGEVIGFTPAGEAELEFSNGRVELVRIENLALCVDNKLVLGP